MPKTAEIGLFSQADKDFSTLFSDFRNFDQEPGTNIDQEIETHVLEIHQIETHVLEIHQVLPMLEAPKPTLAFFSFAPLIPSIPSP